MSGLYDSNQTDTQDRSIVVIGDGESEGNVGVTSDFRLKVDAVLSSTEALKTYIMSATAVTIGTNKSMISVLNASSTKVLKLREMYFVNVQTAAVTGVITSFNLYRMTGHSGGTQITPQEFDLNDTADADITCRTGATITGEFAAYLRRWVMSGDEWGVGSADVESNAQNIMNAFPMYRSTPPMKPITLRQNQGLTLKQVNTATVGTVDIYMVFTEE